MNKKEIITTNNNPEYIRLLLSVGTTLEQGRQQAVYAVNSAMVQTYWEIGRQIVEYEQHGNEKAEYGSDVLNRLSRDLTNRYGKGFSHSNVVYMRRLYLTYPKRGCKITSLINCSSAGTRWRSSFFSLSC